MRARLSAPVLAPLRLAPLLLAACDTISKSCTDIGCVSQLSITVTADSAPVPEFSGTITIGDVDFAVACAGTDATGSAPGVTCAGDGVVILPLTERSGGGDVSWVLSGSDGGLDSGNAGYDGQGTLTPEWSTSQPNGPDCPPICYSADATISLDVLD